jgi:hypothetical protein
MRGCICAKNDKLDAVLIAACAATIEQPRVEPDERLAKLAQHLTFVAGDAQGMALAPISTLELRSLNVCDRAAKRFLRHCEPGRSEGEAIQSRGDVLDCFVAFAPRNDDLSLTLRRKGGVTSLLLLAVAAVPQGSSPRMTRQKELYKVQQTTRENSLP